MSVEHDERTGQTARGPADAMPADLVRALTDAIWRHVHDGAGALADAAGVATLIAECPDPARRSELHALVERIDALPAAEQRAFVAAIDEVQVASKLWLIDELCRVRDLAGAWLVVLGGWYGILPLLLNWRLAHPPARMLCVDLDPQACALGERVVGSLYPSVEYRVADVMELDYAAMAGDGCVLVNTICEHLAEASAWWRRVPAGQLAVLQSNDYAACPDHVNWVADLEAMAAQTPLSQVCYAGSLTLPIFQRFMLIGYR